MFMIKYSIRQQKYQLKMIWVHVICYTSFVSEKIHKNYNIPKWLKQKLVQYDDYVINQMKALISEGTDIICDIHNESRGIL